MLEKYFFVLGQKAKKNLKQLVLIIVGKPLIYISPDTTYLPPPLLMCVNEVNIFYFLLMSLIYVCQIYQILNIQILG